MLVMLHIVHPTLLPFIYEVFLSDELTACWNTEKGDISWCDSIDISVAVATEKVLLPFVVTKKDEIRSSLTDSSGKIRVAGLDDSNC